MLIVELKSDALKERHWRQLCKALKVEWSLSELTLGQVWDADLLHNEHTVKDVVSVAQGEMALEEFLKQVFKQLQSFHFMCDAKNKPVIDGLSCLEVWRCGILKMYQNHKPCRQRIPCDSSFILNLIYGFFCLNNYHAGVFKLSKYLRCVNHGRATNWILSTIRTNVRSSAAGTTSSTRLRSTSIASPL